MAEIMAQHMWGAIPETSELALAGRLHDIGKVAIRTEVLNKPGSLEDDEWVHIRTHPVVGERILSPIVRLSRVIDAIRHHHERFDGTGYPDNLTGNNIPEGARILAIADAYDAMTSNRPYRRAFDPARAAKEIKAQAGQQFDPKWAQLFLDLFETGTIG
jgi:HD-GYP domain-containing protein (c-di-GMP phosphodiesterase class II)